MRAARAGCAGLETHARQQTGVPASGQKGLNSICYVSFILSLFFKKDRKRWHWLALGSGHLGIGYICTSLCFKHFKKSKVTWNYVLNSCSRRRLLGHCSRCAAGGGGEVLKSAVSWRPRSGHRGASRAAVSGLHGRIQQIFKKIWTMLAISIRIYADTQMGTRG